MLLVKQSALYLTVLLLCACQSLGLAQPKSLQDRIAYGYSTYSAVQYAAANAITAGEMSSADGEAVLKMADQARVLLDSAKALSATDPTGAGTKLELAVNILTQLQAYLRAKA